MKKLSLTETKQVSGGIRIGIKEEFSALLHGFKLLFTEGFSTEIHIARLRRGCNKENNCWLGRDPRTAEYRRYRMYPNKSWSKMHPNSVILS